jgi:nucleoside-diphosphate-sugar epimerase
MRVLIIGGTGLISTGIIKHLLTRKADITMLNRGQRENTLAGPVKSIVGDRNDFAAFEKMFANEKFDVVIDMICFNPDQAQSDLRAFGKRCGHFIFCSTVCTYGFKVPTNVFVDENFPQEPTMSYGVNKVACEQIFLRGHEQKLFPATIIRPSCTYGPGNSLIDNLEGNPAAWDRIERGLPVLCAGDGLGLWVSTHRDDCGKLFAYGALNPKTYGQSYNATRDEHLTWRDIYKQTAEVIGQPAKVIFMPAKWITDHDPKRFGLLKDITQFHGAYSSQKAKRDVPEYRCEIDYKTGAKQTLADVRRRNAWRNSTDDAVYDAMVKKALAAGAEAVTV